MNSEVVLFVEFASPDEFDGLFNRFETKNLTKSKKRKVYKKPRSNPATQRHASHGAYVSFFNANPQEDRIKDIYY